MNEPHLSNVLTNEDLKATSTTSLRSAFCEYSPRDPRNNPRMPNAQGISASLEPRSGVLANSFGSERELSAHISILTYEDESSPPELRSLRNPRPPTLSAAPFGTPRFGVLASASEDNLLSFSEEISREVRSEPVPVVFRSSPIVHNSTNSLHLGCLFDSSPEECDNGKGLQFNSFSKETDDDKPDDISGTSLYCEPFSDFSHNTNKGQNEVAKPDHPKNTINAIIVNLFENPDHRLTNIKRISIVIYATYESYRTIISSFLIVFVPQNCGGYSCSILENVRPVNNYEIAAITLNALMAIYFCVLFYLERERENAISLYLVSDNKSPTDKEYLMRTIDAMEPGQKRKIMRLNNWYRFLTQNILFCFFVNASVSCVVIYNNYLNNTTFTVFVTNALFMINRIYKALKITSSGEYNIYSAYRTEQMLYNRDRSTWLQHQTGEFEHRVGVGPRRFIIARD